MWRSVLQSFFILKSKQASDRKGLAGGSSSSWAVNTHSWSHPASGNSIKHFSHYQVWVNTVAELQRSRQTTGLEDQLGDFFFSSLVVVVFLQNIQRIQRSSGRVALVMLLYFYLLWAPHTAARSESDVQLESARAENLICKSIKTKILNLKKKCWHIRKVFSAVFFFFF